MRKSTSIKILVVVVGIALFATAGYFARLYLNNRNSSVVQATPTPIPETPTATPIPTPTPRPSPTASAGATTPTPKLATRMEYVLQQLTDAGFNPVQVTQVLTDPRLKLYPIKQVAYKEPDWNAIKLKLYAPDFVQKGKDYIVANQTVFDNAERDFGVPKEVLAGVIAIETEFGANSGSTLTFNALYSRMQQWPETTWQYQAAQLVALATYCLNSQTDCFTIKGSYAGALGIVQFMPISLLNYGIDGNKDGVIDLYNPADAIPSEANFLARHNWQGDHIATLTAYYGRSEGYPEIVLAYAVLLTQ